MRSYHYHKICWCASINGLIIFLNSYLTGTQNVTWCELTVHFPCRQENLAFKLSTQKAPEVMISSFFTKCLIVKFNFDSAPAQLRKDQKWSHPARMKWFMKMGHIVKRFGMTKLNAVAGVCASTWIILRYKSGNPCSPCKQARIIQAQFIKQITRLAVTMRDVIWPRKIIIKRVIYCTPCARHTLSLSLLLAHSLSIHSPLWLPDSLYMIL